MNPKPLLALNHFTVPCSFNCVSLFYLKLFVSAHGPQAPKKTTCKCGLAGLQKSLKVSQEQQTQNQDSTMAAIFLAKSPFPKWSAVVICASAAAKTQFISLQM